MLDRERIGSSTDSRLSDTEAPATGVFFNTGEFWTIGYSGETFSLKASKGLGYIQHLLQHPREEFHALDLISEGFMSEVRVPGGVDIDFNLNVGGLGDAGEMLDAKAKQDYRRRLTDLKEHFEDQIERGNQERAAEIEPEIEFLTREISRAVGLGGRDRRAGSAAERARLNVTRAIKSSLQKISERHAAFGKLLDSSIRTGTFCSYYNDSRRNMSWQFSPENLPQPLAPIISGRVLLPYEANFLSPTTEQTKFVGRELERLTLRHALERTLSGNGAVVMIEGAPGVGKTRLASEFATEASAQGFRVFSGRCYDRADVVPFNPFVEILEAALVQSSDQQAFRRMLGEDAPEMARLMPQLRRIFPDIEEPLEVSPEQSRRLLLNACLNLLVRAASVRPVLLLLDDLHWGDEGTLSILHFAGRAVAKSRILIVGTYRDKESDPAGVLASTLDSFTRLRLLERVRLRNFSESLVAEMVAALSGQPPHEKLVSVIASATEGNPFFIEELFRHLAERGKLFDSDGRLNPNLELRDIDVPAFFWSSVEDSRG